MLQTILTDQLAWDILCIHCST